MRNGKIKLVIFLFAVIFVFEGCTLLAPHTRTVYVPEGDAVMLRQDVKNVDIWAKPSKVEDPVPGNMTLEEGWL